MKILVTGGAGYIGAVVSAELLSRDHAVIILDNLSKGHLGAIPKSAEFIRGDLADRNCLHQLFANHQIDGVMHFAASIEVGESMRAPGKYFENNTSNSLKLLQAMTEHNVRRFVFSSTAALYGTPESNPIDEDAALKPTSAYGESKLMVEQMLNWFHRVHGLSYASLRYFNAAGATLNHGEQHDPESHLIPLVLQAANGESHAVSIFGTDYPTPDGTCIRDYIHVSDLAKAHVLAFQKLAACPEPSRLIYNLGNNRGYSVREVIETAKTVTGKEIAVLEAPRRPGDPPVLIASAERIRRDLGWEPRYPELHSIIESAWNWKCLQPQGYRDR